jgi:RimJ/RimL family protein N-acetyltransferase
LRDAAALADLAGNWRVARMLSMMPHPYAVSDAIDFIARVDRGEPPFRGQHLAVLCDHRVMGVVSIAELERGPELGYWLGEPFWGKGYMSEAVQAIIDRYFSAADTDRLVCGAFADNHASLRIQEKVGFEAVSFGRRHSRARGRDAPHVETVLTRERHARRRSAR